MIDKWLACCTIMYECITPQTSQPFFVMKNSDLASQMKRFKPKDELSRLLRRIVLFFLFYLFILTSLYWTTQGNPMPKIAGLIYLSLFLAINTVNPK